MKSRQIIVITVVALILFLLPSLAEATNDVSVNSSGNSTDYVTSATWSELENVSIATGTGNTTLIASYTVSTNSTLAIAYGGFYKDGVQIYVFNMTAVSNMVSGAYHITVTETAGTHWYALRAYSTAGKKGTVYNRNLTVMYLNDGAYGSAGGEGNVSSVVGAPAGVLDCTGTDSVTCTIAQAATGTSGYLSSADWNTFNAKITNATTQINITQVTNLRSEQDAQNTSISTLQTNDTVHDSKFNWVNSTYLPNSTYNGNFPNSTVAGNLANWNSTYNGTYDGFLAMITALRVNDTDDRAFVNATFVTKSELNNTVQITISRVTSLQSTLDAINLSSANNNTASQGRDDAMNTSSAANNTASISRDDAINSSKINKTDATTCSAGQGSKWNGTGFECFTDQTSAFTLNGISGSANVYGSDSVTVTTVGSNINLSAPGLSVTNASVNPFTFNLSNGTIGSVPEARLTLNYPTHAAVHSLNDSTNHTGSLNYSRLNNISINLSAVANLTGTLADAYISSATTWNAKIGSIAGSAPIVATTIGTAVTLTCNVANSTQAGCLSSSDWSTFNSKITNATAQITQSQVTGLLAAFSQQADNNTYFNSTFSRQGDNNTYFNSTFKPGVIPFSVNSSVRVNGSVIQSIPGPYAGTITSLNITVVEGSGTANISWYVSDTLIGNVSLLSGSYGSTTGLAAPISTGDTIKAVLDNASTNLRMVTTARTQRS